MSVKEQAIAVVSALPEDVTWDQAIEALERRAALDQADQQQPANTLKRDSPPIS